MKNCYYNIGVFLLLMSFVFCACQGADVTTEQMGTVSSTEAITSLDPSETAATEAETSAPVPAKTLTLTDLEGLDGKAALALMEENGLELGEYYAANKGEAADAVTQILLDLREGRTDAEMMYSSKNLVGLFKTVQTMLHVPDRLQLYTLQGLVTEKGEKLSWSDFESYEYEDIGSGLYIRKVPVGSENVLALVIKGADLAKEPEEMSLYLLEDGALNLETGRHIDIRSEDLAKFLSEAGM